MKKYNEDIVGYYYKYIKIEKDRFISIAFVFDLLILLVCPLPYLD